MQINIKKLGWDIEIIDTGIDIKTTILKKNNTIYKITYSRLLKEKKYEKEIYGKFLLHRIGRPSIINKDYQYRYSYYLYGELYYDITNNKHLKEIYTLSNTPFTSYWHTCERQGFISKSKLFMILFSKDSNYSK